MRLSLERFPAPIQCHRSILWVLARLNRFMCTKTRLAFVRRRPLWSLGKDFHMTWRHLGSRLQLKRGTKLYFRQCSEDSAVAIFSHAPLSVCSFSTSFLSVRFSFHLSTIIRGCLLLLLALQLVSFLAKCWALFYFQTFCRTRKFLLSCFCIKMSFNISCLSNSSSRGRGWATRFHMTRCNQTP